MKIKYILLFLIIFIFTACKKDAEEEIIRPVKIQEINSIQDENFNIDDFCIKFHHFPGHTPGCSMIEIDDAIFSGDFLFKGSIGRWDFPFSDKNEMLESLEKCKNLKGDFALYPGHGESSTLKAEQQELDRWVEIVRRS